LDYRHVCKTCAFHDALQAEKQKEVCRTPLICIRIKGLYKFRALLAHPQEALHTRDLVYCVRVMLVGCYRGAANWHNTLAIYQVPSAKRLLVDEQLMLETCRRP
jgi:hypothetical protein